MSTEGTVPASRDLLALTPLPEVTELPPEDGWRLWCLAWRLRGGEVPPAFQETQR